MARKPESPPMARPQHLKLAVMCLDNGANAHEGPALLDAPRKAGNQVGKYWATQECDRGLGGFARIQPLTVRENDLPHTHVAVILAPEIVIGTITRRDRCGAATGSRRKKLNGRPHFGAAWIHASL